MVWCVSWWCAGRGGQRAPEAAPWSQEVTQAKQPRTTTSVCEALHCFCIRLTAHSTPPPKRGSRHQAAAHRTLCEILMSSDTDPDLLSSFCELRFWLGCVAESKSSTTHSRRLMVTCRQTHEGSTGRAGRVDGRAKGGDAAARMTPADLASQPALHARLVSHPGLLAASIATSRSADHHSKQQARQQASTAGETVQGAAHAGHRQAMLQVATDHLGVQPRSGHLVGRFEVVEEAALHGQHKPAALPLPAVQRQRIQAAAVPAPLLQPASLQVVTQRWQLALQMSGTSGQSGGRQGVCAGWDGRMGR